METMEININLEKLICSECKVLYWVVKEHRERLGSSGETFFCPNGHGQHFTESTQKKLERAAREIAEKNSIIFSLEDKLKSKIKRKTKK